MELFQVQPHEIDHAWRNGADQLGEACKFALREVTPDQLKFLLARGERTLIGIRDNGKVTGWGAVQVHQLPNIRVLYIYSMAGKGLVSFEAFKLLKEYAKANGCTTIRGSCRPSMVRFLKKYGAQPLYQTIEMEAS